MEFDTVRTGCHHLTGGFLHHFPCFPGKPQNDVGHHLDPGFLQPVHRIEIHACGIAPADVPGSGLVDGLQPQLHGDGLDLVQPGEQRDHILPQAVRPGTDGQPHNVLRLQGSGE